MEQKCRKFPVRNFRIMWVYHARMFSIPKILENAVSLDTRNFCKIQSGIFGRMESAVVLTVKFVLESYLISSEVITFVTSLLFFRLAESYSQLGKYYLDDIIDVDKRLNWQVKEIFWKGEPLPPGVCTARIVVRSFE